MTHHLRFPDEATGMAHLRDADLTYMDEDGDDEVERVFTASHHHSLDVIGAIPDLNGWHVNYIGDLPDGWDAYLVTPEQPVRVWA